VWRFIMLSRVVRSKSNARYHISELHRLIDDKLPHVPRRITLSKTRAGTQGKLKKLHAPPAESQLLPPARRRFDAFTMIA
jgi:hypothetical protein